MTRTHSHPCPRIADAAAAAASAGRPRSRNAAAGGRAAPLEQAGDGASCSGHQRGVHTVATALPHGVEFSLFSALAAPLLLSIERAAGPLSEEGRGSASNEDRDKSAKASTRKRGRNEGGGQSSAARSSKGSIPVVLFGLSGLLAAARVRNSQDLPFESCLAGYHPFPLRSPAPISPRETSMAVTGLSFKR